MDDVKIYHYFRCTIRKHAESFADKGQIKLNIPKAWIELEKTEGKGRGDLLEGVYAKVPYLDIPNLIKVSKMRNNNINDVKNGHILFKSQRSIELPCYCLYGLCNTSFQNTLFSNGEYAIASITPISYFTDFYHYSSREEIDKLDYSKRPVLLVIRSTEKFRIRLIKCLEKLGISEHEILLDRVKYMDKQETFYLKGKEPMELFTKDNRFASQCEIRIVLNIGNKKKLDKLKKANYIIELGDMSDIVEIYDYYLEDMIYTIDKHMHLKNTLPEPVRTLWNDMDVEELLSLLYIMIKKVDIEKWIGGETKEEFRSKGIAKLEQILCDKHDILYYVIVKDEIIVPDILNPIVVKSPKFNSIP